VLNIVRTKKRKKSPKKILYNQILRKRTVIRKDYTLLYLLFYEEKRALNRDKLAATTIRMLAGVDNRWDQIHPARFLPGAACSAAQLWLLARENMGNSPQAPIYT
jgi:hypothetical protein